MKRRIVSIICIMFLLFAITSPISGSIFSYADETQQEQLSEDETIVAGLAAYLNDRKAWIINQSGDDVGTVFAVMRDYINAFDYWSNDPLLNKARLAASILIKYSPFRISLKGSAVRAFNDLYDWLVDTGKLSNLENSNGGETTDNLYNGWITSDSNFYVIKDKINGDTNANLFNGSDVELGTAARGFTSNIIYDRFLSNTNTSSDVFDSTANVAAPDYSISVNYFSDLTINYNLRLYSAYNVSDNAAKSISPCIRQAVGLPSTYNYSSSSYSSDYIQRLATNIYADRVNKVRGNPAYITYYKNGVAQFYVGIVSVDISNGVVAVRANQQIFNSNSKPISSSNVNISTDNFDKTNPTPPEGDDELEYTPEDKTTGDTYNTYIQYITNYVKKNTVINNTEPEPSPGGTTPPWDGGDTTVTPDGDGFNLNLPDLTLPDLDIDWSINGLSEKFPFSIPWDLMAFFTVLNAEPETPAIEAQIDLGIVDWDIDWDLHNFDTLAALLRNLEFIGFCLALILITRSIIKG